MKAIPFQVRAALALALFLTLVPQARAADEALHWSRVASEVADKAYALDPLAESRTFAMLHVAIHDALNAVDRRYTPHTANLSAPKGASAEAAAATAAHGVLSDLLPDHRAAFDAALSESLAGIPAEARDAGAEVGRKVAAAVLAARRSDGASRKVDYVTSGKPGDYRPTPPENLPAFFAQWGGLKPFVLRSSSQFRPPAPPKPGSPLALAEMEEVRRLGGMKSTERTEEQSQIAKYWYEKSPQGWTRIAREIITARAMDPWDSARLLALANVAMADGFIAGFEAKYHYRYWRPVTAIQEAGNKDWATFLSSPPVPDHPSTHTVLGAAAATAMARALGTDLVSFSMTSGPPYPGITRKFWSLSEAARENGASRVLCGIHFPLAVRDGYRLGEQIGNYTFENAFRPVAGGTVTAASGSR